MIERSRTETPMSREEDEGDGPTPVPPPGGTVPHRRRVAAAVWSVRTGGSPEDDGASLDLRGDESSAVLVGTSSACILRLEDPTVSRRHLSLEVDGMRLRVRDLESTNGTRVNGVLVREAYLEGPARLELGAIQLDVHPTPVQEPPALSSRRTFGEVVGASVPMRRLYPLCERLAETTIPVVIEGETGTGKEVLAESLHAEGPRAEGPFVVFDCTTVPESLVEAELFGHARGAFTGANGARSGVYAAADGGTLLLDEIGDLPLPLQAKLLRVIDRGEVRPVGSDRTVRADVRILAATRRDLDAEVAAGRFRDDLFHRLAVARIALPPLRDRRDDIPLLATRIAARLGAPADFPEEALLARWRNGSWPGNVRELRNAVARALALGELEALATGPAPSPSADPAAAFDVESLIERPLGEARAMLIEAFERRYVAAQLARHEGNVTRAARAAGVARRTFQLLKARRDVPRTPGPEE